MLDVNPPKDTSIDYIQGSVTDPDIVQEALKGMDTFVLYGDAAENRRATGSSVADFSDIVANYEGKRQGTAHRATRCERGRHSPTLSIQVLSPCMSGRAIRFSV